jgi:MATE family multidrug resistance protein
MTQLAPRIAHARQLLSLGLPLVGANLAGFLIHMTDTLMLGWYDVTALAAATVANGLWFVVFIVGAGFGHAVTPMVAEAVEQGDDVSARRITRMGLWLSMAYGLVAVALLWRGADLLRLIGQPEAVAVAGGQYLSIAILGFFPALAGHVMRSFLGAVQLTAVQLWITLAALVMNAGFNYALIFGNLGSPELGVEGAALASVLTHAVQMGALMAYAQWKRPDLALFRRIWNPDAEVMARVFRLGLPVGGAALAESGLFTGSSIMMGWLGEVELAAHGIALQLTAVMFMFHVGMSNAATIRIGSHFGRRDGPGMRRTAEASFALSMFFGIFAIAVFLLLPETLVSAFVDPDEPRRGAVIALGAGLVMIGALFQFVDAAQIVALSNLRGMQDTNVPMWLAALSYWGIGLPAGYVLGVPLGLDGAGVWFGMTLGLTAAALMLTVRLLRQLARVGAVPPAGLRTG